MHRIFPIFALLAALALAGCADLMDQLKTSREVAGTAVAEAEGIVADTEAELEASELPADDPVRQELEQQLAQAKDALAKANQGLATADAAIASIESGEVSPELREALNALPYGAYAGLAVSIFFAIRKRYEAQQTEEHLKRVVRSVEVLKPKKSPGDKEQIKAIQGPDTTAKVKEIKAHLGA